MAEWLDYTQLQRNLNDFMPALGDRFILVFDSLLKGDDASLWSELGTLITEAFEKSVSDFSGVFFLLLVLGILVSLLKGVSGVFGEKSVGEAAGFLCYLCTGLVLLKVFFSMTQTGMEAVEFMLGVTEILIPYFYIAVAMSREILTAAGFYQLNFILLYAMEVLIPELIMPLISGYAYLSLLSGLTVEDNMQGVLRLFRKGFGWINKAVFLVVGSVGMVKKMIHSATDGMNLVIFHKTFGSIPGIGDLSEGMTSYMVGAAVLIKNGLGIAFLIVLLLIICAPVVKILFLAVMLQCISAIVGLFGNTGVAILLERICEACMMLVKTMFTAVAVFMIIIALVCVAV